MKKKLTAILTTTALATIALPMTALADMEVTMHAVSKEGVGQSIGTVTISEDKQGLVFTPSLQGLSPGLHGFHVHQNPTCKPAMKEGQMAAAVGAGGHYAPNGADAHGTPWGEGHLGDLPALFVDEQGKATHPVLAPRLKKSDLKGRALMIHAGGDNYSDQPQPLGGGGARVACGVIESP